MLFLNKFPRIKKKEGDFMKKIIFLLTLSFPVFVNAEVSKPLPYPSIKNGMVIHPEGNGHKEYSYPCPKYSYDCNTPQIQKIQYIPDDISIRCEQERCPNRLILKGYPYQKSFLSCPKETPLMDKNGKCYTCDIENSIELPENYNNPCPKRKTFHPTDEKTLRRYGNEKERLAPTCSPDKPLLIQEGYYARCIECDDEFENYPRVISKQDCDVCSNRTYFSGWCVNGTREKPLVSSQWVQDGKGYRKKQQNVSCDTDEDILMDYFGSDWCSAVCPNRFRIDPFTYPVKSYCVKKTLANHIRNFWIHHWLKIILFGIISLFLLPKILKKLNKR